MCGRITLTEPDFERLAEQLGVAPDPALAAEYRPRYNVPPTDPHPIVVAAPVTGAPLMGRRLVPATWGFTARGGGVLVNARAETAAKNGLFRRAFAERRCIVPADGFFEWTGARRARRPIWFHAPPGALLHLAGLFEPTPDGYRFTILTTTPNAAVAPVHDRMPAILLASSVDRWLHPDTPLEAAAALLGPAPPGTLVVTPVSSRASSVANDDPACVEPLVEGDRDAPATPPRGQLRLLD